MRAWLLDPAGGPESLRLVDMPVPSPEHRSEHPEAIVRVEAVALDAADAARPAVDEDALGAALPGPYVPGVDVCGRIIRVLPAAGSDLPETAPKPGARVVCHLPAPGGGFAEQVAVPLELVALVPPELDPIAAASLATPGLLAWDAVERRLRHVRGSRVLVTGADTALGLWAVEFARLFGATVIGLAAPGHEAVVRAHGAMHVLHPDDPDITSALRSLAPGGLDDIIDTVSAASATAGLARLRLGGHLVAVAGRPDARAVGTALLPTISEVSLRALHDHGGAAGALWLRTGLERLIGLVCEGHLDPPAIELVAFSEIPAALASLIEGPSPGRLVANLRWGRWASRQPAGSASGAVHLR